MSVSWFTCVSALDLEMEKEEWDESVMCEAPAVVVSRLRYHAPS